MSVEETEQTPDAAESHGSDNVEEATHATDEQAAGTEEITSMVDQTAANVDEISDETDGISATVEEQAAMVSEVNEGFRELPSSE